MTTPELAAKAVIVHEFPAMGGTIEVQLAKGAAGAKEIEELFHKHEQVMSRFLPWSELCALNAAAPGTFVASSLLFDAVRQALDWARTTNGVFDPTVIDTLDAIGYDRSFDLIGPAESAPALPQQGERRWSTIALDAARRTIVLPQGVGIDLGGIGKGYTVDRAIDRLGAGANAIVNASGDLRAVGSGPGGEGWRIGIEHPFEPGEHLAVLAVRERAVATSGSAKRRWIRGGKPYHHLIDTRAMTSSDSDLLTVTVVAPTATDADVLAKVAFLIGSRCGLNFVERFGAEALALTLDGRVLMTQRLGRFLA